MNSLSNGKILAMSKLKAFADNKLNITETMILIFYRVEKIVRKGHSAFYPFPTMFSKVFLPYGR